MKDGLYIVSRPGIYAAFVVERGEVTQCAPILRAKLDYWKEHAKWVPTSHDPDPPEPEEEFYPPVWHEGCV